MGVPTFFRWLCTRYPKVIKDAVEKVCIEVPGEGGDGASELSGLLPLIEVSPIVREVAWKTRYSR